MGTEVAFSDRSALAERKGQYDCCRISKRGLLPWKYLSFLSLTWPIDQSEGKVRDFFGKKKRMWIENQSVNSAFALARQGTGQCPTHFSLATGETRLFRRTLTSPCATRRTSLYLWFTIILIQVACSYSTNASTITWGKKTGFTGPKTEWHFDIQKMSAIPHHIEERWGQILHKRASFVPNETERFVQFRSTPSKGSLYVRPGTVWSYVLIPSHRTCWHPLNVRLQSQRRTSKGFLAGEFDVLYLMGAIFSLSEKRVFAVAVNHDGFYRILRASVNVKMKAKCANQIQIVHKRRADMARVQLWTAVSPASGTTEV